MNTYMKIRLDIFGGQIGDAPPESDASLCDPMSGAGSKV